MEFFTDAIHSSFHGCNAKDFKEKLPAPYFNQAMIQPPLDGKCMQDVLYGEKFSAQ